MAFFFGRSLGDFLLAVLDEMVRACRFGQEFGLGAVPSADEVQVFEVTKTAAGWMALKFGMTKGLLGLLESAPSASEEKNSEI